MEVRTMNHDPTAMPTEQLINELQSFGVRLVDPKAGGDSRRGGAGPSDHRPMTIDGATVMVPVHTAPAFESPYRRRRSRTPPAAAGSAATATSIAEVTFQRRPRFYERTTADGIPYSKIATLHGRDVLATTVLQTCIRYQSRTKTCQFCAIGQSLAAGRTIERKTPEQLAEVAQGGRRTRRRQAHGDDHRHAAGQRPRRRDPVPRARAAVKAAVDLPIQGTMRAARRRCLVRAHEGGRRRCARHASGSGDRRGAPRASCPARRRCRSSAITRRSRRRCRSSAAARSRPTFSPASATAQRGDPRHLRAARRARRLSLRGAVRADLRARRWKATRRPSPAFMHAILGAAGEDAARRRLCARSTSRPAAANAAPARRCRLMSGRLRHDLRPVSGHFSPATTR